MSKIAAIVFALDPAHSDSKPRDKLPFKRLNDQPTFLRSLELFMGRDDVEQTILVIDPSDVEFVKEKFSAHLGFGGVSLAAGGPDMFTAVAAAMEKLDDNIEIVALHDALRPAVSVMQIDKLFETVKECDGTVLAMPLTGAMKRVDGDLKITETFSLTGIYLSQYPQVFQREALVAAEQQRESLDQTPLDHAQLAESAGKSIVVVTGSPLNVLLSEPSQTTLASAAIKALPKPKVKKAASPFADEKQMW